MPGGRPPNILFLLTDQQRIDTLSSYGGEFCRTPHLDALARESVQFDRAYCVTPVCTPARASLQTGLYPSRHGMQNNIYYPGCVVHELADSPRLLSRQLARAGYAAGFTGKWHLGFGRPKPDNFEWRRHRDWHDYPQAWLDSGTLPSDVGYMGDDFPGHGGGGHDYPQFRDYLRERGLAFEVEDVFRCNDLYGRSTSPEEASVDYFLVERAITHIDRLRSGSAPFFFMLNFWGPHAPCYPTQHYLDLYRDVSIPPWPSFHDRGDDAPRIHDVKRDPAAAEWSHVERALRHHYAHMTMIDAQIGRLLAYLRRAGLYEDTVIVFSADHGDSFGIHGGLTDKSFFMFEEVCRIPLYIKPAGAPRAGRREERFVNTTDLYSTILEIAGVPRSEAERDGRSLVPLLDGENPAADWPDQVVVEACGLGHTPFCQRMIRRGPFKFVFNCGDRDEFYDLQADPHERVNQIAHPDYAEPAADLREALAAWMQAKGDPLLEAFRRMRATRAFSSVS